MRFIILLVLSFLCTGISSQTHINKQQAYDDIDAMIKIMEDVHFNPYLHISKTSFASKTDSIKATIKDSVDRKILLLKLYALTAFLEDGHAAPALSLSAFPELKSKILVPFSYLSEDEHRVYIASVHPEIKGISTGARLISINGKDIQALKKKSTSYIGGLDAWKKELSTRLFSYFIFLNDIKPPFNIVYEEDNIRKTLVLEEGVDLSTSLTMSLPAFHQPPWSFRIIDGNLGYIDFVSMSGQYNNFISFLDSSFRVLREKNINHLAVDLRSNSGGDSKFGDILLGYIAPHPFALGGKKQWKISRQYKDYVLSRGDSTSNYLQKQDGEVWILGECGAREKLLNVDTLFTGKVYLLTGSFTYSSANMLAEGAKYYKLATLVGEPTGESTNDFGEVYSFILPNSKFRINSTTSYDMGVDCDPSHNNPVTPHKFIKRTVNHVIKKEDPVLDYVLNQVR